MSNRNSKGQYLKDDISIELKFWILVDIKNDSECWEWLGIKYPTNYGRFWFDNKEGVAHRFSYKFLIGDIPKELIACHKCDNRSCVNPHHIFLGTYSDNIIDSVKKKRQVNIRKTHCIKGHPFNKENTYVYKSKRGCRLCRKLARDKERKS